MAKGVSESEYTSLWNYFYRGVCVCALSAKAFDNEELINECNKVTKRFQEAFPDRILSA